MNDATIAVAGIDAAGRCDLDEFQGLLESWKALNCGAAAATLDSSMAPTPPGEPERQLTQAQPTRQTGKFSVKAVVDVVTTESTLIARRLDVARDQVALLERELDQARKSERMAAIEVLRALVRRFELKPDELTPPVHQSTDAAHEPSIASASEPSSEVTADEGFYLGPSGQIWLGRGRRPTWLK